MYKTQVLPKQPGWYWWNDAVSSPAGGRMRCVSWTGDPHSGGRILTINVYGGDVPISTIAGWWYGPLDDPFFKSYPSCAQPYSQIA